MKSDKETGWSRKTGISGGKIPKKEDPSSNPASYHGIGWIRKMSLTANSKKIPAGKCKKRWQRKLTLTDSRNEGQLDAKYHKKDHRKWYLKYITLSLNHNVGDSHIVLRLWFYCKDFIL